MKWTAACIRAEMARLDEKTGLRGRELPIYFIYRRSGPEGLFIYGDNSPQAFVFNKYSLDSQRTADYLVLDVIRHEYAHYMDLMLNGEPGEAHGENWLACCQAVGAMSREEQLMCFLLNNEPTPTEAEKNRGRLVRLIRQNTLVHSGDA